jgi:hypothetical protein
MKSYLKLVPVLLLLVLGAVASGSAMAQWRGHGGGVRFGINLGVPLYGPGYYPGYYPYPYGYPGPAYAYPGPAYGYPGQAVAPPTAYVEQGYSQAAPPPPQAQPQPQPQGDWYHCDNSNAYYPYVRECPEGWQRVPAQPPR